MSVTFTPRQLLTQTSRPAVAGPALGIEADVPLTAAGLASLKKILESDQSLVGVEVFTSEDEALGVIPREAVSAYISSATAAPVKPIRRGGNINLMEGGAVGDAPLYACAAHEPPYQRLMWSAAPEPPKCKVCRQPMQRTE